MSEFNQNDYQKGPQDEKSGLAIASMILGIVSVVLSCLWYIAGPCGLIGLILGIISKVKKYGGKGFSTAGIILSVIGMLLCIVIIIVAVVFVLNYPEVFENSGYKY